MNELPVLAVKDINKQFPGVKALNNVSFAVNKGEIHALVGENGAGKSTLVNIIMGLIQPDSGEIYVKGKKVVVDSPLKALTLGIGIVPQELNLVPYCSVAENIFLGIEKCKRGIPKIDWNYMYCEAENILSKIGATFDVRAKISELSVAYQQLVQIARALAFGAKILILDEPTACLSIQEANNLFRILEQFKEEGRSIIYISHHMDEIERISDRVSVMRDGNLITTANMNEISIGQVIKLMVGREIQNKRAKREKKLEGTCVLKVRDLCKRNKFNNINFELNKGEILGIAGLVGAGRSELARAIYGEIPPDRGEIFWKGKKVCISSPSEAIKIGIGYVPEERRKFGIFPAISVEENISMPILSSLVKRISIDRAHQRKLVMDYIDELKIKTPSPDKEIRLLSGGNQQKAIIARWLAKKVELLILDEPTRGIDVNAKGEIHDLIYKLSENGLAVILISSELEEVINLSDRIMVMHEGNIKGFIDSNDVTQEDILKIALN